MISIDSWWDSRTRNRFEAILELVMDAVADDYERLEMIMATINESYPVDPALKGWEALKAAPVSRHEGVQALRELTGEGYAQAYVYDAAENRFRAVGFGKEQINDLWFYATPKGLNAVKQFPPQLNESYQ
ncbi:MAG TPA: hypothetical protein VMW54_08785 [Terriglobia bacterium]|nr:hypothetical protein [Terriglobia bacterium]